MKYAYPASHLVANLDNVQLTLKIARHSPCSLCSSCAGFHPPPDVQVILDDDNNQDTSIGDLGQYNSDDDDDDDSPSYLETCACGHSTTDHNASDAGVGREEFARRGRVAIRLDELLKDAGKLLDFDYSDDDIVSLKHQMRLPDESGLPPSAQYLAELLEDEDEMDAPPPKKRRRVSFSSSSASSDDDSPKNIVPTTSRIHKSKGKTTGRTVNAGKKVPSKSTGAKGMSRTGPLSHAAAKEKHVNGMTNGHDARVKVEDKMDDAQLNRLAAGVPVDAASPNGTPPVRQEKMAAIELRKGVIKISPVENDGQPRSWILLTGLKTLFQKQLPKMPREYIARLVYDVNSKALGILKRGYKVVGGILYRPFPQRGFAEIVFFATHSVDQVKGYGSMLMDHFKAHVRKAYPNMMHFLTYADNYAVGYFEKQGFSKEITLDRAIWAGYIKDYEGANLMQCTMLDKVDYLDKVNILALQQDAVIAKIRQLSRSHIIHPGLPQFQEGQPEDIEVSYKDVPGLKESGWSPDMEQHMIRPAPRNVEQGFMEQLLRDLQAHPQAWPFAEPVKAEDVQDYYNVIAQPMDLRTMEQKLDNGHYNAIEDFSADVQLICDNCRTYNPPDTVYYKAANKLEKFYKAKVAERVG